MEGKMPSLPGETPVLERGRKGQRLVIWGAMEGETPSLRRPSLRREQIAARKVDGPVGARGKRLMARCEGKMPSLPRGRLVP